MSGETYELRTIQDLLKVPAGRRQACFRDLEYALLVHELALGECVGEATMGVLKWVDDGDCSVDMSLNDKPLLSLKVTKTSEAGQLPTEI